MFRIIRGFLQYKYKIITSSCTVDIVVKGLKTRNLKTDIIKPIINKIPFRISVFQYK